MNNNLFCAVTESDKPRILKGGFRRIKTVMYANVFQDLIWSFALGQLKIYRHMLVNDMTSNTQNQAEQFNDCDFGLIEYECQKPRSIAFTLSKSDSWSGFDVTAISISWNNHLRRPGSLRQLSQLYNKKVKNIFMFMRYVDTTVQNLEA